MLHEPFEDLTLKDVERLKENEVSEGKMMEYKRELHLENSSARKEFAADVTSFANGNGGNLLIGIDENEGIISEIPGYVFGDQDSVLVQIENILRDMIEPRIIGLRMQFYKVSEESSVLHLKIPRSYNGPHIVSGKRFYGRNSAGKYQLDYAEIRSNFLMQADLGNEIRDYRVERAMKVKGNSGYMPLVFGPSILIHVIPLQSFAYDSPLYNLGHPQNGSFRPFFASGWDFHIGFEGIANYSKQEQGITGYHHFNRKGITEIVDKGLLNFNQGKEIVIPHIEKRLINVLNYSKENYARYEISGPYAIMLSLMDIEGYKIIYDAFSGKHLLQQDLFFPEIIINDLVDIHEKIQPFINLMCNAAGLERKPKNQFSNK